MNKEEQLRVRADEAVSRAQAAKADAKAAAAAFETCSEKARRHRHRLEPNERLEIIPLEVAWLEAEDRLREAMAEASAALDAAELAEGSSLVSAMHAPTLVATLVELDGTEAALRAELDQITARRRALVTSALEAEAKLCQQRRAANLPSPVPLPKPQLVRMGEMESPLEAFRRAPSPVKRHTDKLNQLRNEELELRASIQRGIEAAAKVREESKFIALERDRARDATEQRNLEATRRLRESHQAEEAEKARLAAAQRAGDALSPNERTGP